jgi:RimJ/RimL family protein N-acetyltransferase
LVGYDEEVAQWVSDQLKSGSFGDCKAIGMVYEGKLIAGVVFFCYRPPTVEMSIASISKKFCTKTVLRNVFDYPFNQLNCKRITITVDANNAQARQFDERLGFVCEGILKDAHPNGDAAIYRMLKSECRWI